MSHTIADKVDFLTQHWLDSVGSDSVTGRMFSTPGMEEEEMEFYWDYIFDSLTNYYGRLGHDIIEGLYEIFPDMKSQIKSRVPPPSLSPPNEPELSHAEFMRK